MRLECEYHHARKRWSWEFEDFEKHSSWELTVDDVGRQLGCLPLRQTVEVGIRPWWWEVGVWPWCWEVEIELRFKIPRDVTNVWGGVSIVWYKRLLRIVSLLMSKKWGQKLIINAFVSEQRSPPVLYLPVICISLYLCLHMHMNCCYWYHYDYGCGIQHF